ncbi:MAG TPA: hypothetical protein VKA31_07025 [Mariprofundaceae bacterium]|nr:hypothetical protein [Mariprofundaceae bacterium]
MIKTNIIEPGSIIEFLVEGNSNLHDVLDIISSQYRNISTGILWNFVEGSNSNLSADEMIRIVNMVKKHAIHKRTAYIGSVDLEYGILRMYEAYAETSVVLPEMKVFRDRDEALQWIKDA